MNKPESAPTARPSSRPRTDPGATVEGPAQITLTLSAEEDGISLPPPSELFDPYLGAVVDGRYLVEQVLGEGGMGVVYRCRHTIIDKLVAMKVLRADLARNEEVTERFLNEARSASSIGSPHIIDISDFGRLPDGATYFIMEFLDGIPLSTVLDEHTPLSWERMLTIGMQLADGLAAAHERGIVHRDLKPDNIFLLRRGGEPDFVKILDFGIAKASASTVKLTQAGQIFGTPHYMSPEQAAGATVDHRSDIYSLGVILYEMATGQLPFDAENFMAILTQHMYKQPTPPRNLAGRRLDIPPELENVILRCLAKRPSDRFQTMTQLHATLQRIQMGESLSSPPPALSPLPARYIDLPSTEFIPRPPWKRAAPAIAALVLLLGAGLWMMTDSEPTPTRESMASSTDSERANSAPAAPAQSGAARSETTPATAAPKEASKTVAIAVVPLEAHLFRGNEDLGRSPVVVQVGDRPVQLEARHPGHETEILMVDGAEPKLSVMLRKVRTSAKKAAAAVPPAPPPTAAPPKPTPPPPPTPKPKKPSGDLIVNPWD